MTPLQNGVEICTKATAVGLPGEGVFLIIDSQLGGFNLLPACKLDT